MGGLLKELLPVGTRTGRPDAGPIPASVLSHAFDVGSAARVDRAVVVTSSVKAAPLMDAIEALEPPFPVVYAHQAEPRGLGAAVLAAASEIADAAVTLLVMPDTIIEPVDAPLRAVELVEAGAAVGVTLHRSAQPERFGVASFTGRRGLQGFVEKPLHPPSRWIWTSVAFAPAFLDVIGRLRPVDGEVGVTEALDLAVREIPVEPWLVQDGAYHDVGTYDDYLAAIAAQPRP